MRRVSKKRAALDRKLKPLRAAFVAEFRACWVCGMGPTAVHEIACGMSTRSAAIAEPATWFAACWICNGGVLTDYSAWPLVRQLAAKLRHDPGRFDLAVFNQLRGREPNAITLAEVKIACCREADRG